jgi:two-component system response regulator RegA
LATESFVSASAITPPNGSKRALVVDDEAPLRATIGRILELNGFSVCFATNRAEAMNQVAAHAPEHAVVDLMLGKESGLDVVTALRETAPATRIVVVTGFGSIATAVEAIRLGAVNYLSKPIDPDELLAALDPSKPRESKPQLDVPTLERAQWEYMQRVLQQSGGNVSEAARRLGLHRQSLQRMLKRNPPRS